MATEAATGFGCLNIQRMDFLKDMLGKKLDPEQLDAILGQIRLHGEQAEMRDRNMAESIAALRHTVEELAGAVAGYNLQLRAMSGRIDNLSKLLNRDVTPKPAEPGRIEHVSADVADGRPKQTAAQAPAASGTSSRRFYATLDPEGGLREVGDNYRNKAPIVATVNGDTGEAAFNVECLEYCMPRAESAILPFFDYTIESSTPTVVVPHNTARIIRKGDVWEMSQRIKITLS